MTERSSTAIPKPTPARPFVCAWCGWPCRSVYSLPGETGVKMCSGCFFRVGEAAR